MEMDGILQILSSRVVKALRSKGLYITTVESCTGGGLVNALTNIVSASEVLKGAFVCYSTEQKIALGVPAEIIERYTVYSTETAVAMAETGFRACVQADVSVGITGSLSRTDPANRGSVLGAVYIAVARRGHETVVLTINTQKEQEGRTAVKNEVIAATLHLILSRLEK